MPSHLRHQSHLAEPMPANVIYHPSTSALPTKKNKMSLTQTYYVASTARSKLGKEAGRADHNLRLLVGHANLLDTLMVELADAEREQEAWFNQSVRKATKTTNEPRHIQWIDSIIEEEDEEVSDDESDDGSDIYDEDEDFFNIPVGKIAAAPVTISSEEIYEDDSDDEDEYIMDDAEYDDDLALQRTTSKHSPPELLEDVDSESDDDSMPSSPEAAMFEFDEKNMSSVAGSFFGDSKSTTNLEDYVLRPAQAPLIAAC